MSTKTYDRQTGKFLARVAENMPEMSGEIMQSWIDNPKGLQKFLAGLCMPVSIAEPDSTLFVDRTIRSIYPNWVEKIIHPELEKTGPAEYDISKLELWIHDGQKDGNWVKGQIIYEYLKTSCSLKDCLSLRDLEEIQKKGVAFFRKHFAGKAIFAWKSVVLHRDGNLLAPYLYECGDKIVLAWYWLEYGWDDHDPAPRFTS